MVYIYFADESLIGHPAIPQHIKGKDNTEQTMRQMKDH